MSCVQFETVLDDVAELLYLGLYYGALNGQIGFTMDSNGCYLFYITEKEIDKYVKKGEKKLKKKTDKAIKENRSFTNMSNTDFEVLFDALDRTNEVQFRTLFTPLAQTNMVSLIRSQTGYGDDFNFIKHKRTNKIISQHSQGRDITLTPSAYRAYSFDEIKENFITQNTLFFKNVYFDFAPLWAIPIYQERPVHSLKPIPDYNQNYSYKMYESLSNKIPPQYVVHPKTQTPAILKTSFVNSKNDIDEISVLAYSYDIIPRIDFVMVHGGDGRWHSVPVPWDDYIPLQETKRFFVSTKNHIKPENILAQQNDICISIKK